MGRMIIQICKLLHKPVNPIFGAEALLKSGSIAQIGQKSLEYCAVTWGRRDAKFSFATGQVNSRVLAGLPGQLVGSDIRQSVRNRKT
jgi:hypothetical protein